MPLRPAGTIASGVLAAVLLVGCGGGGTKTAGIATLTTDGTDGSTVSTLATDGSKLTEDKALAYAKCMRDNGVESFADPTVDSDGNVRLFTPGAGGGDLRSDPEFETARTACASLIEGVTFGGGRGGFANSTEIQDAMVKFSDCLRGEGLDVGDLTLPGPGGGRPGGTANGATVSTVAGGSAAANGSGPAGGPPADGAPPDGPPPDGAARGERGPGGDPSARIAEALGLDTSDPAVTAALTKCQPILTDAFQAAQGSTTTTTTS
ncbi:MAG: hypothetical protein AB7V43_06255 [Acidimicrobiia bacterium]